MLTLETAVKLELLFPLYQKLKKLRKITVGANNLGLVVFVCFCFNSVHHKNRSVNLKFNRDVVFRKQFNRKYNIVSVSAT